MERRLIDRFLLLLIILACVFLVDKLISTHQSPAMTVAASEQGGVQPGLVPRFIDFDIGAATVRSGATHQGDTGGIADIPPYVLFPPDDSSVTLVNFTVPPDFDTGGDFEVRLIWSAYSANTFPCFFVLNTELVGYGPGHSAALFDPYWDGSASTSDDYIVQAQNSSIQAIPLTFKSLDSFPAHSGDIVTFSLWRLGTNINDTCNNQIALRSISMTYQGLTTYLPVTINGG